MSLHTLILTMLAMLAFAGNSLLCRMALQHTDMDAASFTSIRLLSGALMLWLIIRLRQEPITQAGSWLAALALFAYAACFSIAYISLPTGTGALLLFGSVQITMIGYGVWKGERLQSSQGVGLLLALAGLIGLLLPGVTTPSLHGSLLMLVAGAAWGLYSLLGKGVTNPTQVTAGNFLRTVPFAIALSVFTHSPLGLDWAGMGYAIASGAIASGMGYALWYRALPQLQATQAATVQLSVPILAAVGAILFLHEPLTLRLGIASVAVLGGIALVIQPQDTAKTTGSTHLSERLPHQLPDGIFLTLSTPIRRKLVWSLWFMTWMGLLAGLVERQWYEVVVGFSVVHALLFIYLERGNLIAFPVQVRLAYVAWVAIGTYVPYLNWLMWITTVGLATNLLLGYCPLARLLSLLPLNRHEAFSLSLVRRVFLSPPVKGRFVPPSNKAVTLKEHPVFPANEH